MLSRVYEQTWHDVRRVLPLQTGKFHLYLQDRDREKDSQADKWLTLDQSMRHEQRQAYQTLPLLLFSEIDRLKSEFTETITPHDCSLGNHEDDVLRSSSYYTSETIQTSPIERYTATSIPGYQTPTPSCAEQVNDESAWCYGFIHPMLQLYLT